MKQPICRQSIHFFGLKLRQELRSSFAQQQIQQWNQQDTTLEYHGMVLAIPLTQAAVGPFAAFSRLRQGDHTSCLLN
jgi:hypothetical protein